MIQILFIAISLSMDAAAVSCVNGMSLKRIRIKNILIIPILFALFQGIMPIIGYFSGLMFQSVIKDIDHFIIFIILSFIGVNMIIQSIKSKDNLDNNRSIISFKTIFAQSIATSIDALAVGVAFVSMGVNIWFASILTAIITYIVCIFSLIIGHSVGNIYKNKAEIIGGIILIIIGTKILIEHLFLI